MKINTVAVTALLIGATSLLSASSVYSPSKGIICDRKAGFCTDSYGISLAFTKEYLGAKAGHKWSKILSDNSFNSQSFTMSNGLSCDTRKKVCKKSKWDNHADAHWTHVLFGRSVGNHSSNKNSEFIRLAKNDCKDYISEKFEIPRSVIHAFAAKVHSRKIIIPISIKSQQPYIDEEGKCSLIDGDVSYRPSY
jgi:hypothetical protein